MRLPWQVHDQAGHGVAEAFEQGIVQAADDDHPRTGTALLPLETERRPQDAGDRLVGIGAGIDDDCVLAAHLGDHALDVALPGLHDRGALQQAAADVARAGEGDDVGRRVIDEVFADRRTRPGQVGDDARGHAGLEHQLDEPRGDHRRVRRRLQQCTVAADQRRRQHAGQDREREVPRRYDHGDAARLVAVAVRLAGHRDAARQRQAFGLVGVEHQEIDRLADVGVRLGPVLAGLEYLVRGEAVAVGAQALGHAAHQVGTFTCRARRPRRKRTLRDVDGQVGLGHTGLADAADQQVRVCGAGRAPDVVAGGLAAVDQRRDIGTELGAHAAQRGGIGVAFGGIDEASWRRVAEPCRDGRRVPVAGRDRRCKQVRIAARLGVEPALQRLAAGILEQAPYQVGHARDRFAERHIDAQRIVEVEQRRLQRVGHAVQHLELDRVLRHSTPLRARHRYRDAARIVGRDRRMQARIGIEQACRAVLETGIGLGLARPDRDRPAMLGRQHRLLVPVGAAHQADVERHVASAGEFDQVRDVGGGVAQVGLKRDPDAVPVGELGVSDQAREHRQHQRTLVVVLHVQGHTGAGRAQRTDQQAQTLHDHVGGPVETVRRDARCQRRQLDRELQRPRAGLFGAVDELKVAVQVALGLGGGQRHLADPVQRHAEPACLESPVQRENRREVCARHEPPRDLRRRGAHRCGHDPVAEHPAGLQRQATHRRQRKVLIGEVLVEQRRERRIVVECGQDIDEAQCLDAKALVAVQPQQQLADPAVGWRFARGHRLCARQQASPVCLHQRLETLRIALHRQIPPLPLRAGRGRRPTIHRRYNKQPWSPHTVGTGPPRRDR